VEVEILNEGLLRGEIREPGMVTMIRRWPSRMYSFLSGIFPPYFLFYQPSHGSITTGFNGSVRPRSGGDESGDFLGRTSQRFGTTRDDHGNLVSIDTADPGLLIGKHK
jgi:hypothetical protein